MKSQKKLKRQLALGQIYALMDLHWIYSKKLFYIILSLVGALQILLLYMKLNDATFFRYGQITKSPYGDELINGVPRLEEYMAQCGWERIFYVGLLSLLFLLISGALRQRSVSSAIYTYERLPLSEGRWYGSIVVYHMTIFCIYLAAQLIIILLGYGIYIMTFPREAIMTQSLFLAFVRWDFLLIIFPLTDPIRLLANLFFFLYLGVYCSHQLICIHYRISSVGMTLLLVIIVLYWREKMSIGITIATVLACILASLWMINIYRQRKEIGERKGRRKIDGANL